MNNDLKSCPICRKGWDQETIPRVLPNCGHSICLECLQKILQDSSPKCPFDNTKFSSNHRRIDQFPVNYMLKQLLERLSRSQSKTECQEHGEYIKKLLLN